MGVSAQRCKMVSTKRPRRAARYRRASPSRLLIPRALGARCLRSRVLIPRVLGARCRVALYRFAD